MCPSCISGNHKLCYDGDIVREELEIKSTRDDGPVPWFGCACECEDGVVPSKFRYTTS